MNTSINEKLRTLAINISASGDNNISGTPGAANYIAADFISFVPNVAVTVQFYDGASSGGRSLSGPISLAAQQALTWENSVRNPDGILTTGVGNALVLNLNAAVQVSGTTRYREVGN